VAERLEWSNAKISRIENARVSVLPRDVKFLLGVYGIEGEPREVLLTLMDGGFNILGFPEATDPDVVYLEGQTGGLYLEKKHEIERYSLAFDHLRAAALHPNEVTEAHRARK
jgi:hypothetical protein